MLLLYKLILGETPMYPKIIIAGYEKLSEMAKKVLKEITIPDWITVETSSFLLQMVLDQEKKNLNVQSHFEPASVVITGEQVAYYFKGKIDNFIIPIKIAGFNFLETIQKNDLKEVTVVHFYKTSEEIDNIANILNVKIRQVSYKDYEDVEVLMQQLNNEGVETVIGGSFVCEIAEKFGMKGIFYYSEESVRDAIYYAVNILIAYRKEMQQSALFRTVVNNNKIGILALNENSQITVISSSAEKLLNESKSHFIGKKVKDLLPQLAMPEGLSEKEQVQSNLIIKHNNKKIVANHFPVKLSGEKFGSIITLEDLTEIQNNELKIREKIKEKSLFAQYHFKDIVGSSKVIINTIDIARRYSQTSSSILITGESGTGKELFAQSIHNESERKKGPFVAINCAALPENLLNSELFGYEEGAFTGAKKGGKQGLFELAHKGTIFLDEISEMPLHLQSRLLRVLQEKEVMRLGGDRIIPVDIRIITATNKNLELCVKEKSFREDLYYRISVLQLYLPPLRLRLDDIKDLLLRFPVQNIVSNKETYNEIVKLLMNHDWPGNIREFENVIERFLVFSNNKKLTDKEAVLFMEQAISPSTIANLYSDDKESTLNLKNMESDLISQALSETNGNKELAAKKLGISRTTLWRKLNQYSLS